MHKYLLSIESATMHLIHATSWEYLLVRIYSTRRLFAYRVIQSFRSFQILTLSSYPFLSTWKKKKIWFSFDQLDFAMWPVSKKRGKRDPPGHPVARGLRARGMLLFMSPFSLPPLPFQYREKNFFPTACAAPSAPLRSLPLSFLRHENSSRKMIIRFR